MIAPAGSWPPTLTLVAVVLPLLAITWLKLSDPPSEAERSTPAALTPPNPTLLPPLPAPVSAETEATLRMAVPGPVPLLRRNRTTGAVALGPPDRFTGA